MTYTLKVWLWLIMQDLQADKGWGWEGVLGGYCRGWCFTYSVQQHNTDCHMIPLIHIVVQLRKL